MSKCKFGKVECDVVIGYSMGDESKSKVCSYYLENDNYTHVFRYSGGENAGHTTYINGKKLITHMIPIGVAHNLVSVIGQGCVLNERSFFNELNEVSKVFANASDLVRISNHCHIVQDKHLEEDSNESKLGTTRKGIGPCYADKARRTGLRAEDIPGLKNYIIDTHEEFYQNRKDVIIMAEGAQGMLLDIDNADNYPYCTSSNCGVGSVINNGISYKDIRDVIGVAKCYDTYVGMMKFENKSDPILEKLGDVGEEYGATTGRRRQVNYLNINNLLKSHKICGSSRIIINKVDVMQTVGDWKVIYDGNIVDLKNEITWKKFVTTMLGNVDIIFSGTPYSI